MVEKLNVLLIEDSEDDALLVAHYLKRGGYEPAICRVETVEQMTAALEANPWDVAISDYNMPGFSGTEALHLIQEKGIDLPFLIVSGVIPEDIAIHLMKAGAADYIMKSNLTRLIPAIARERREYDERCERRRAEQKLREVQARQTVILDSILAGIVLIDPDTRTIIDLNEAAAEVIGTSKNALIDVASHKHFRSSPTLGSASSAPFYDPSLQEGFLVRVDGSLRSIIKTSRRVEIQGREVILVSFIDISEKKDVEQQLVEAQKLATIGTLVAGVAHEINSPLQVITGLSRSLADRILNGKAQEMQVMVDRLETIERNAWRVAEIVRVLRTYAHPGTVEFREMDLNAVIKDTLLLIGHSLKTWTTISVQTNLQTNLPTFQGNYNQIIQVLINLITNAVDAMPNGGELTLSSGVNGRNKKIFFQVKDTGEGMPKHIIDKIYSPYFTTKPPGKGTGLGLSIVSEIIKAHHGEIAIQSVVKQGTAFTISFPLP